jgi:hypothetical protein
MWVLMLHCCLLVWACIHGGAAARTTIKGHLSTWIYQHLYVAGIGVHTPGCIPQCQCGLWPSLSDKNHCLGRDGALLILLASIADYILCVLVVGKNAIELNGGRLMFRVHLIRGQNRKPSCGIHQVVPAMLFLSLHNCEIITCWIFVLATAWPAVRTYNCVTDGSTLVLVGLLYFCFCHAFGF